MLTTLLFTLALAADPAPTTDPVPYIPVCQVASINNQAVPGVDPGVLTSLSAQEGMLVTEGQEIGRIDETEARAQLEIKGYEFDVAQQQANSTVDIEHATESAKVNKAAYDKLVESNKQFQGTVTAIDILRAKHEYNRGLLAIQQAKEKKIEAQLQAKAKKAEVEAVKVALDRRVLRAPFDGVVVKVGKKPGEWVASGEPIVHIVGVNRLRVMGNLDAKQWGPGDVADRNVTVEVELPRGRSAKLPGKVTFVSPVVVGQLAVWAEVDAPAPAGKLPEVRAGLKASMTIHVDQPVAAAKPPETRTLVRPASASPPGGR